VKDRVSGRVSETSSFAFFRSENGGEESEQEGSLMIRDDALENFILEDRVGFFVFTVLDESFNFNKGGERFGELLVLFIILRDQGVDNLEAVLRGKVERSERAGQINVQEERVFLRFDQMVVVFINIEDDIVLFMSLSNF